MSHRITTASRIQKTKSALIGSTACFCLLVILSVVFPLPGRAGDRVIAEAGAGDPERGKQLFEKRCTGCHALDQDKEGPRLRNVYGRKAGSISTFKYSGALKSVEVTWDDASLEKWLTNPEALVPDTDMVFRVPKADERADIIRFLRVSSGK
jgi:cytochrome c